MQRKRKVFVFIGPQGSGKGTQATVLSERHGFQVFVMGRLLRQEVQNKTVLGQQLHVIMNKGELVPDDLIMKIMRQELEKVAEGTSIILDGFPRTLEQARALGTLVVVNNVIYIDVPHDISVKRIAGRLVCAAGHEFNTSTIPPKKDGVCDRDGKPLVMREDDTSDAVEKRLQLYRQLTTKVLAYYKEQGKLITINGDAPVADVTAAIESKIFSDL